MDWTCAVDRIEGRGPAALVVLVGDDAQVKEVPRRLLGRLAVEGAVLRIPQRDGELRFDEATRDRAEERRRIDALSERLKRLQQDDPGGDLSL